MERAEVLQLIEQAKAENSTRLDLSDKGLVEIPPEIFQLSNLQILYLGRNQITAISRSVKLITQSSKEL